MIDFEELYRRLNDMYPFSYAMARTISINFSKIYQDILPDDPELKQGQKSLTFEVGLDNDGVPRLAASHRSLILFTAIAQTMLEMLKQSLGNKQSLEEMEKSFILTEKICQNPECGAVNKVTAKFCDLCGQEFK